MCWRARQARPTQPDQPLAVTLRVGLGRVAVFADSDLFGDDSIDDYDQRRLWTNVVTWAGLGERPAADSSAPHWLLSDPDWLALKAAIERVRPLQSKDGSLDLATHGADAIDAASTEVDQIMASIRALRPRFAHDGDYLDAVITDLGRWRDWRVRRTRLPRLAVGVSARTPTH